MIHAELFCHNSQVTGFCVRGHAGYSESGSDVVCAGVTTAVQLTANGITECARVPANVEVKENEVRLELPQNCSDVVALKMLEAFELQLKLLSSDYGMYIELVYSEV